MRRSENKRGKERVRERKIATATSRQRDMIYNNLYTPPDERICAREERGRRERGAREEGERGDGRREREGTGGRARERARARESASEKKRWRAWREGERERRRREKDGDGQSDRLIMIHNTSVPVERCGCRETQ